MDSGLVYLEQIKLFNKTINMYVIHKFNFRGLEMNVKSVQNPTMVSTDKNESLLV